MSDYHYLVFSGGGAAGYAYAGALMQLNEEEKFSFDDIKAVAGSSVGAVIALLIALNYDPAAAGMKLSSINFKEFADGDRHQLYRLFTRYGRFRGKNILEFIKEILREKTGCSEPEDLTFADLKALGCKDLYVVTTKMFLKNDIPSGKQKIFSYEKTPDTSVAAAVLASTSAPPYFPRVRLKKIAKGKYVNDDQGDLFEDGGILNNYALELFDSPKYMDLPDDHGQSTIINPHTLGFILREEKKISDNNHQTIKRPIPDGYPIKFVQGLINSIVHQAVDEKLDKDKNLARTVQIDRKGVKLNDFDISEKIKTELVQSGRDAVKNYFANIAENNAAYWPREEILRNKEHSNDDSIAMAKYFGT